MNEKGGIVMNYLFNLNPNYEERDAILDPYYVGNEIGGTQRFEKLPLNVLEQLIEQNFIDLDEYQNASPSVREFHEFLQQYPQLTVHGYSVCPTRSDYRVSIEGLSWGSVDEECSKDLQRDFVLFCRTADELTVNDHVLFSWWD